MSHLDPNRDFREPGELPTRYDSDFSDRGANTTWGWIFGGVAAVVLVLIALSIANRDTETASNLPPAPPAATESANPPAPPETTGQGSGAMDRTPPAPPAPPAQPPQQ